MIRHGRVENFPDPERSIERISDNSRLRSSAFAEAMARIEEIQSDPSPLTSKTSSKRAQQDPQQA
jgi:hypothetical protein